MFLENSTVSFHVCLVLSLCFVQARPVHFYLSLIYLRVILEFGHISSYNVTFELITPQVKSQMDTYECHTVMHISF